jgi:hypothetical protein
MTCWDPLTERATNFSEPGCPPHATAAQMLSAAEVCAVQVTPSGEVITRLPEPV